MQDKIEKSIELKAPVSRVWRALTDHKEFGEWFRVALDSPFRVSQVTRGQITYPGYEHLSLEVVVKTMDAERLFAFTWYPISDIREGETATSMATLVEFKLEASATGTLLTISESGFAALPDDERRVNAFRQNTGGWEEQTRNIAKHVEA